MLCRFSAYFLIASVRVVLLAVIVSSKYPPIRTRNILFSGTQPDISLFYCPIIAFGPARPSILAWNAAFDYCPERIHVQRHKPRISALMRTLRKGEGITLPYLRG